MIPDHPLVVLVDDSPTIRRLFERRLGDHYAVRAFEAGEALLAGLETLRPSLFVLDWMLPDVEGPELCRRIRAELAFDPVPIAFYTGIDPSPENVRTALEAGADAFLHKGSDPAIAVTQIRALVESYRRISGYLGVQAAILSALKHDIANWLTGISTTAELLAPEVAAHPILAEDVETIRASSRQLVPLLSDLGELLTLDRGLDLERSPRLEIRDVLAEARTWLSGSRLSIEAPAPVEGAVDGCRRALGRVLHYLVRLLEARLPPRSRVELLAARDGGAVRLGIAFEGDPGGTLEGLLAAERLDEDPVHRRDLLPVEYVRRMLRLHGTAAEVSRNDERTEISFRLATVPEGS